MADVGLGPGMSAEEPAGHQDLEEVPVRSFTKETFPMPSMLSILAFLSAHGISRSRF
jgi:hypothetical protein